MYITKFILKFAPSYTVQQFRSKVKKQVSFRATVTTTFLILTSPVYHNTINFQEMHLNPYEKESAITFKYFKVAALHS